MQGDVALLRRIGDLEKDMRDLKNFVSHVAITDVEEPKYPTEGTRWFNPSNNLFKIWRKNTWQTI